LAGSQAGTRPRYALRRASGLAPLAENVTATRTVSVGELFAQMPLTREHWKAGIALFFAFVIEAWEMMIIIIASGMIATDFELSPERLGSSGRSSSA